MTHQVVDYLVRQHETAWKLARFHLDGLSTEECLWRPAARGLHVHHGRDGMWHADWPEHEGYDLGPPSIAWPTWHMGFWWSMVLNHSFSEILLLSGSKEDRYPFWVSILTIPGKRLSQAANSSVGRIGVGKPHL